MGKVLLYAQVNTNYPNFEFQRLQFCILTNGTFFSEKKKKIEVVSLYLSPSHHREDQPVWKPAISLSPDANEKTKAKQWWGPVKRSYFLLSVLVIKFYKHILLD